MAAGGNEEGNGQMELEIPMEEGEPLGATPNDKLIITKIQGGTIADGKLKIGDQILKVNGQPITDQNNFFKALRFAPPLARLTIVRGWMVDPGRGVVDGRSMRLTTKDQFVRVCYDI